MVRVRLVAALVVVDAVAVVHEGVEGGVDGDGDGSDACHGLHHLGLILKSMLKEMSLFRQGRFSLIKQDTCGLYYQPRTIVNDDARIVNKFDASLTDDARVIIYDRHMFIVQAIGSYQVSSGQSDVFE
jgi:hypothetical protein